jgi:hypothetical protein
MQALGSGTRGRETGVRLRTSKLGERVEQPGLHVTLHYIPVFSQRSGRWRR